MTGLSKLHSSCQWEYFGELSNEKCVNLFWTENGYKKLAYTNFLDPVLKLHFVTSSENLFINFKRAKSTNFETFWQVLVIFRCPKSANFFNIELKNEEQFFKR